MQRNSQKCEEFEEAYEQMCRTQEKRGKMNHMKQNRNTVIHLLCLFEKATGHCICYVCELRRTIAQNRPGWQFISHMIGCRCVRCRVRSRLFDLLNHCEKLEH
ncbi:MAG: hypothetical protein ACXAC5_02080 [Promethearchaeota archaeon]